MRVEVSPGRERSSGGPNTYEGFTTTTCTPMRAPAARASDSPSCLASGYVRPRPPPRYTSSSLPARSGGAGPIPATLEVTTTRLTPSAAAASTAIRGPRAFTPPDPLGRPRGDAAGGVEDDLAAPEGAPQGAAVEHVGLDRIRLDERGEARQPGLVAIGHPGTPMDLGRKVRHVRADETGGSGDADGHNFTVGMLLMRSYTAPGTVTQCRNPLFS